MDLPTLFEQFMQAGIYLRGWSLKTPAIYRRAFASFGGSPCSKPELEAWLVRLRKRGLSPACCNIYIRAMNAFASWLLESGYTKERVKLQQLKTHRTLRLQRDEALLLV